MLLHASKASDRSPSRRSGAVHTPLCFNLFAHARLHCVVLTERNLSQIIQLKNLVSWILHLI